MTLFVSSHASLLVTFGASEGFASRRLRTALPRARFFRVPLSLSRHSAPPFSAFGTGTSLGIAVGASSQPWGARPRVRGLRAAGQRAERSGARRGSLSPRGEGSRRGFPGGETRTKYCCIPYATSAVPHNARVYLSYAFTNFFDAALFPSLSSIASSREPDAARHGLRRETGNGSHPVSRWLRTCFAKTRNNVSAKVSVKIPYHGSSVLHRAALLTPRPFPP